MSIFMMVMIGGGIIFIDDKARGLHEGYLVTPITKFELIAGFNLSGTIKAVLAGCVLMTIGSLIAGVPDPFEPMRLLRLFVVIVVTAFALISMMFLLMVRVTDPLVPRAIFGVLNTLLYFPSGAVYPQQGFPAWMQAIAVVDPFTYAVHAFKSLLLKNTGFGAIAGDLGYLVAVLDRRDDGRDRALQADAVNERPRNRASGCSRPRRSCSPSAASTTSRCARSAAPREPTSPRSTITSAGQARPVHGGGAHARSTRCAGPATSRRQAGEGGSAEQKLRIYIRVFLERLAANGRDSWIHQLISREMSGADAGLRSDHRAGDPAAARVPGRHRRRAARLGADRRSRVMKCIASIQSQVLLLMPNPAFARSTPSST